MIGPLGIGYLWIQHQLARARREVKQGYIHSLSQEELTSLRFSHADAESLITWKEEDEFIFQGQLYDILRSHISEDSVLYICWLDEKENALNDHLAILLSDFDPGVPLQDRQMQSVLDFCKSLYSVQHRAYLCGSLLGTLSYPEFVEDPISRRNPPMELPPDLG